MPHQEPAIPHEEPVVSDHELAAHSTSAPETAVQGREPVAYEPIDGEDDWQEEPAELPRRPRRRLLTPIPLALLGVLLTACGFIAGALVEKGQSTSSSSSAGSAASLVSRFRALRAGAGSGTSAGSGVSGGSSSSSTGFTRPTAGTVAYLDGSTLYVTNSEGNTVKVTTSAGTSVTKTVKASVKGIHPGESVTVTGATASNGTVGAESISVGAGGGGLAGLFGGSSSGGSASGGSASGGSASGGSGAGSGASSGGPALFGGG